MSKRNYHRLTQNPWTWKPVAPETAEQKTDRKRREAIGAEKRAKQRQALRRGRPAHDSTR